MALNLEAEIAGRLGVRAEDVRPVLETVIERVRQQVAHYGYARLAGLGTFRGQDGSVTFEPDPGLAEAVNVRFAGLGELDVQDLSPTQPAARAMPPQEFESEFEDEPIIEKQPEISGRDEPFEEEEPAETFEDYGTADETYADRGWPEAAVPEEDDEDVPAGAYWATSEAPEEEEGAAISSKEEEEERWREESGWSAEASDQEAFVDEAPLAEDDTTEIRWRDEAEALDEEAPSVRWEDEPLAPGERAESREPGFASLPDFDEEEPAPGEYEELSAEDEEQDEPADEGGELWRDEPVEAGDQGDRLWHEEPIEHADEGGELWHDEPEEEGHPLGPLPDSPYEEADYSFIEERDSRKEAPRAWSSIDNEYEAEKHTAPPLAPDRSAKPHERIRQQALRARQARAESGPNRSALWLGAAVVLIVAAAAVGYFAFMRGPEPTEPAIVEQTNGDALTDSAALQTDTSATQPDVTAVVPDTSGGPPAATPPVQSSESTPLNSADPIDPSQGGYTVIVASETSRSSAEGVMERYRRQGYRTGVLEAREGGVTRYRVGVGQFSSMSQAERTRTQLAGDDLPADAWVRRVR